MAPLPTAHGLAPVQVGQQIEDFFINMPDPILVGAGATVQKALILDQDADFSVQKLTGWVTDQGVPPVWQAQPLLLVQFRSGGSGRDVFSQAVPFSALFGTGQLPFILPTPRIIRRGSTVTWEITNIGATAYTAYLLTIGKKTFEL
jgi:hypothetical protein